MTSDRVEWHLWNWAQWVRRFTGHVGMGWRKAACGMGYSGSSDVDAMTEVADIRCAKATDAAVDSLPLCQRRAVHTWHMGAEWTDDDVQLSLAYHAAVDDIGRRLERRAIA